jgi:hypothetical protein
MKPHLVKPSKRTGPSMALRRQAVRLFSSDMVPLTVNKRNRREWLRSVMRLGDSHVLRGGSVRWGTQRSGT